MRRIKKLKGNVEHFRYLKSKSRNPQTANFNDHYRNIFGSGTNLVSKIIKFNSGNKNQI